jgi:hypothetical protein
MMKNLVAFFEIPALDFKRTVNFYEKVFGVNLQVMECETESMAFFADEKEHCYGAISYCPSLIQPSDKGVLLSLSCEDMDNTFEKIISLGGKKVIDKTKIESEGMGYFGTFIDCEGNKIGLYSDK